MNEGIKKVLDTIYKDEAFAEKMKKCESPEEAYEVAQMVADGYTLEEFQDVMTQIHDAVTKFEEEGLSEEDLIQVSGGVDTDEVICYTVMGVVGAGAVGGVGAVLALVGGVAASATA